MCQNVLYNLRIHTCTPYKTSTMTQCFETGHVPGDNRNQRDQNGKRESFALGVEEYMTPMARWPDKCHGGYLIDVQLVWHGKLDLRVISASRSTI